MKKYAIVIAALVVVVLGGIIFISGNFSISGSTTMVSEPAKIEDKVQVDYWLTIDGKLYQTTEGSKPFSFTIGAKEVLQDFEDAVIGLKVGESKEFVIPSENAYPAGHPLGGKDLAFKVKLVKIE